MKIEKEEIYLNDESSSKFYKTVSYDTIASCPLCHATFSSLPNKKLLIPADSSTVILYCFYVCLTCHKGFIVEYKNRAYMNEVDINFYESPRISPIEINNKVFDDYLANLSKDFTTTYNEAYAAEQYGLKKICGMGYRRALEYLIKDYLIYKYPEDSEHIKETLLSNCINDNKYDINSNIKEVAKRCAWLGNDHSHYIVKHTDKDLDDLKELLDITALWILMELKTEEALKMQHK